MNWVDDWVYDPFSWQNELSISFIDFPVMWQCFSLTMTLRFCGCVKNANIDFVLLKRFDEHGHHLITILLLLLLFYYYYYYYYYYFIIIIIIVVIIFVNTIFITVLRNYFNMNVNFQSRTSKFCKIINVFRNKALS